MLKQVIELFDLLDSSKANGEVIKELLLEKNQKNVIVESVQGDKGKTDFIKIKISGIKGKDKGGDAPTLGIIGRLGGLGARPERIGFVSDGDGALTVLSVALKLSEMATQGDHLDGDVIVTTHICPDAPTRPHDPVPFMDSPVDIYTMNKHEIDAEMDAILSVDTTKGNRIINHRGFAVSPTVKEGYILRVSEDLLDIMQNVTGKLPVTFPITTQDITPYGNGIYHLNSILQPSVATKAPVVGVAITAETPVPGCATGATHLTDIEMASRFCLEVAKAFGRKQCRFFDEQEFSRLKKLYGDLSHLQTFGNMEE